MDEVLLGQDSLPWIHLQFWNQLFHTIFVPILVNPSWDINQIHLQQNYFSMLDLLSVSIWQTEILVEYKIMQNDTHKDA